LRISAFSGSASELNPARTLSSVSQSDQRSRSPNLRGPMCPQSSSWLRVLSFGCACEILRG
jgi:hypothetical protein